jgi:hypothetical protein
MNEAFHVVPDETALAIAVNHDSLQKLGRFLILPHWSRIPSSKEHYHPHYSSAPLSLLDLELLSLFELVIAPPSPLKVKFVSSDRSNLL